MRGNPLLGLTRYREKGLKVNETKRGAIEPCSDELSGAKESQRTFHGRKRSRGRASARPPEVPLQCHLIAKRSLYGNTTSKAYMKYETWSDCLGAVCGTRTRG